MLDMVFSNSQCDQRQLRQLLDDRLPQESQDTLARHLESCADCRKELESMAADPDWWSDAQQVLSTIINFDSTTSTDNVAKLNRILNPNAEISRLGFLSASADPTKLGRLGPYEIVKVIGRGGMGIVLMGFDSALNRHVAIKVLAPQWIHSAAARLRFAREAKAAAAVVHEHVIAIYAVDSANEIPYLVMPFIDGISLQERIDSSGPLELKEILRIGIQIAAGLAAAHAQGLVHRDIKPANILLENSVERVLITDFGLARAVDDASFTRSCFIAGTPEYMAPEQANGEFVDHRTDLFSLGSVIYAMCTGQSPFRRETTMAVLRQICEGECQSIREINPDIPIWLAQIVEKLHAKNPSERFQTSGELAELLKDWLDYIEQPSSHRRPRYPTRRWLGFTGLSRRTSRIQRVAAVTLLLIIAGLTTTEIIGTTHLLRLVFGVREAQSPQRLTTVTEVPQVNPRLANHDVSEFPDSKESVFEKRISELWQQLQALETKISTSDTAGIAPETVANFRSQLAKLQAELPEYRQDPQLYQLQQVRAAIEQLKQPASPQEVGPDINSSLIEINDRIEQLKQDLYRDFP